MYVELRQIQSTIQQIVMAISSVLKIEVEVADSKLFRIAGTGLLKQKIWKEMSGEDAVYRTCVERGKTIIIDEPGINDICKVCPHFGNCVEYGEICTPISVNQNVIGVIGLIAFSPEQKKKIFSDIDANIFFLKKMAEVIATKINENIIFKQQLIAEKKISTLINCIDMGLMMLNNNGNCEFISNIAKKMLNFDDLDDTTENKKILSQFAKLPKHDKNGHIVWIDLGQYQKKFFLTVQSIDVLEKEEATVVLIEDPDHITRIASHISIEKKNKKSIIGQTPELQNIKQILSKIKSENIPILIRGEDGTGKTFSAHFVHLLAGKPENKFRKINVSYYSEEDLNHILFGDEKDSLGLLEKLDGGTLVLDDIDQIGKSTQIRLTKFMNDGLIQKKQGAIKINVRIISITSKNLLDFVHSGSFRQDLYYKIGVVPINMPPLRDRRADIMPLANYFLELLNVNSKATKKYSIQVPDIMLSYNWPGNIQELSNVIEYAFNVSDGPFIRIESFPDYVLKTYREKQKKASQQYNLNTLEIETIKKALLKVRNEGKKKEDAASLLGIGRATLYRKISQYRIKLP